jgi:hypothetical protein
MGTHTRTALSHQPDLADITSPVIRSSQPFPPFLPKAHNNSAKQQYSIFAKRIARHSHDSRVSTASLLLIVLSCTSSKGQIIRRCFQIDVSTITRHHHPSRNHTFWVVTQPIYPPSVPITTNTTTTTTTVTTTSIFTPCSFGTYLVYIPFSFAIYLTPVLTVCPYADTL